MAATIFLKLDGIQGESREPHHFGEIELLSFSLSPQQIQQMFDLGFSVGSDFWGGSERNFSCTKRSDSVSHILMRACAEGRQFKEVTVSIDGFSAQGPLRRSRHLLMLNCVIESFQTDGAEEIRFDQVGISFEKLVQN